MALSLIRLMTVSVIAAVALPMAPAMAGWRDGGYYADDGWENDYYPPAEIHRRPVVTYPEDYQPDYDQGYRGYDRAPWAGRRAYGQSYYDEPAYAPDDDMGPAIRQRPLRPPRNVAVPDRFRPTPLKPRTASLPPKKPDMAKPRVALAAPVIVPTPKVTQTPKVAVQAPKLAQAPRLVPTPKVLPVPRPNLESMDFEAPAPVPVGPASVRPAQ